jgi:hypothetical protein
MQLYERWLREDAWRLRAEAVPLLVGANPADWGALMPQPTLAAAEQHVWDALVESIKSTQSPRVLNADADPAAWRISPAALFQWASATGIVVPEAFDNLIRFIMQVVRQPVAEAMAPPPGIGLVHAGAREKVLGAALNLLAKCPERCLDEHGFVSGAIVVKLITAQSVRWFDTRTPPLSESEMADLIDKWLE